MSKKKSKFALTSEKAEFARKKMNDKIAVLGEQGNELSNQLNVIQEQLGKIQNIPSEYMDHIEKQIKKRHFWKQQAELIESEYKATPEFVAWFGGAVAVAGVAVAAYGPKTAMGIATGFGVASTGTSISSLRGVAETNAMLAWLGGGTLANGAGGMAAGNAFLHRLVVIGWIISGVAIISTSAFFIWKSGVRKKVDPIFILEKERDTKKYELATNKLEERITNIKGDIPLIKEAIIKIPTFAPDYNLMTENQKKDLCSYVNLTDDSTGLLVDPITTLQSYFSEEDFLNFVKKKKMSHLVSIPKFTYKELVCYFSNRFSQINVNEEEQKILWKYFRHDKQFLKSFNLKKREFDYAIVNDAFAALDLKEKNKKGIIEK